MSVFGIIIITLVAIALGLVLITFAVRRRPQQPQQQTQPQQGGGVPTPASRNWLKWLLSSISILCFIAAVVLVKEVQTGALALVGLTVSNAALALGLLLVIVSLCWFNLDGTGWPAKKVWGTITAILAGFLLLIAAGKGFLISWLSKAVTVLKGIKVGGILPFLNEHWLWVLVLIGIIGVIILVKSPGIRKFLGWTFKAVLVIGLIGAIVYGLMAFDHHHDRMVEVHEPVWVEPSDKPIDSTLTSHRRHAFQYPDGWNWKVDVFGPREVDGRRDFEIEIEKSGHTAKLTPDNMQNYVRSLPQNKDPIFMRVLPPPGVTNMSYRVVVTFTQPTARR